MTQSEHGIGKNVSPEAKKDNNFPLLSSFINLSYGAQMYKNMVHREREKKSMFSSTGILVNGELIGAKKPKNEKLRTYFGKLGFYFQREDVKVEISTETITLSRGSRTSVLSWSDTAHIINHRQVQSHRIRACPPCKTA